MTISFGDADVNKDARSFNIGDEGNLFGDLWLDLSQLDSVSVLH